MNGPKRRLSIAWLALGLLASRSPAVMTGDFLPLEVGNQWTFQYHSEFGSPVSTVDAIRIVKVVAAEESAGDSVFTLNVVDSVYAKNDMLISSVSSFQATLRQLPDSTLQYSDSNVYTDGFMKLSFSRRYFEDSLVQPLTKGTLSLEMVRVNGPFNPNGGSYYSAARGIGPLEYGYGNAGEVRSSSELRLLDFNGMDFRSVGVADMRKPAKRIRAVKRWSGRLWFGNQDALGISRRPSRE